MQSLRSSGRFFVPLHVWLLATCSWAQVTQPSPRETAGDKRAVVVIIGASLSAGFTLDRTETREENATAISRETLKMAHACRALWPKDRVRIVDVANSLFFIARDWVAKRQVKKVLKEKAALVIGLDFMFWYGYGHVGGAPSEEIPRRLTLQRKAFALLQDLKCPLVLGDYPDMHHADRSMLRPQQIPSVKALKALNSRLRTWAAKRKNNKVVPLSAWVRLIQKDGADVVFRGQKIHLEPKRLLQKDGLHVRPLGLALLVDRTVLSICSSTSRNQQLRPSRVSFEDLVEHLDASEGLVPAERKNDLVPRE